MQRQRITFRITRDSTTIGGFPGTLPTGKRRRTTLIMAGQITSRLRPLEFLLSSRPSLDALSGL